MLFLMYQYGLKLRWPKLNTEDAKRKRTYLRHSQLFDKLQWYALGKLIKIFHCIYHDCKRIWSTPSLYNYIFIPYSVSVNDSVENEDISTCDEKKDTSNVAAKDLRKLSPQQEAIRTYLNSRNINVTQEEDVSGSDSR